MLARLSRLHNGISAMYVQKHILGSLNDLYAGSSTAPTNVRMYLAASLGSWQLWLTDQSAVAHICICFVQKNELSAACSPLCQPER